MKLRPVIEVLSLKRQQEEANVAKILAQITHINKELLSLDEQDIGFAKASSKLSHDDEHLNFNTSLENWRVWRSQKIIGLEDQKKVLEEALRRTQETLKTILLQQDAMQTVAAQEKNMSSSKNSLKKNQENLEIWVAQRNNL